MILKNLKTLVDRYPVAVVLNFLGLVCAFVAFALIFLQADYELSFDRYYPTAERVFRADKADDESLFRNILPRGFADDITESSTHIEAGCSIMPFFNDASFSVAGSENETGYIRKLVGATERFIEVFGIKMIEGDARALEIPGSVIIPKSLADAISPDEPALGKLLKTDAKYLLADTDGVVTIKGVYEDFPGNCQLDNALYLAIGDYNKGSYGGANFVCYLLLDDAANAGAVAGDFNSSFDFSNYENWLMPIELVPLTSVYFRNEGNIYKSGSRSQLMLMIAIAILILAIGLINFTNFYVAQTPLRIRNINLQKILGSSTFRLRMFIIMESLIWCICSFFIAALLIGPVSEILMTKGILMQSFSLAEHWDLLVFVGTVAIATGLVAGIWPGIYSTSGQPAMILRGRYGLSSSGRTLRTFLVGFQFVVSIALLVFVLYLQRQSRYMQEYPCGYDKENLAVVNIGAVNSVNKSGWLREHLRQLPEVTDVAFSAELVGGADSYDTESLEIDGQEISFSMMFCSWNLPGLLGVDVAEGRLFNEGEVLGMLFTKDVKEKNLELGPVQFYGMDLQVVGFLNPVNVTSMRMAESPVCFAAVTPDVRVMPHAYIRLADGFDRQSAIVRIEDVLKEMDPVMPFEIQFYDTIGKNLYSGEERLRLSVWLFSMLAVLLSLVGIWGQVLMDVQYKKMEISVKRVFGAETGDVIGEGLLLYLRTVAICYVIAAPLGWLIVRSYLRQFTHRVGFAPSVFIIALVAISLVCAAVVLFHYIKTSRANPVDSLKSE